MTAFFRKRQVRLWRLICGSLIGTTYLLILFVDLLSPLYSWPGKLLLSMVMIIVAFGLQRMNVLLKDLLVFYVVGFLFGGGMIGLGFLLQGQQSMLNGFLVESDAYVYPQATLLSLIFGYLIMFVLSRLYFQVIEVGKQRSTYIIPFKIWFMDQCIEAKGLLDTGNQLHEPITGVPVMVLQVDQLFSLIPKVILDLVRNDVNVLANSLLFEEIPLEWQSRIRLIPYRGVGKGNQLMLSLTPDLVELKDGNLRYQTSRVRIGLTAEKVSADSSFGAILHPKLVSEQNNVQNQEEAQYANTISP